MGNFSVLLVGLLVAVGFAGCTDDSNPAPAGDDIQGQDAPEAEGLSVESSVPAPVWNTRDWFGHHIFFGSDDTQGEHVNTIVYDQDATTYRLATDSRSVSKEEAAWDFPMLGDIFKANLETTAFTADWNIYQFPLSDGLSWTATFNPLFSGPRDLTLTATFAQEITTPQGIKPGFLIEGVNAEGMVELQTDYIPEIRWYSELVYFDPNTEDEEDFILRIRAMGQGENYEGPYFLSTATPLVQFAGVATPFDAANSQPPQYWQFDVTAEADVLYGLFIVGAATGASSVDLLDPNGEHIQFQATHTEVDPTFASFNQEFDFVDITPVEGQWDMSWLGPAAASWAFLYFWEIQHDEQIMN